MPPTLATSDAIEYEVNRCKKRARGRKSALLTRILGNSQDAQTGQTAWASLAKAAHCRTAFISNQVKLTPLSNSN